MHVLQAELERRWQTMFAALAGGDDVPPGQRLRCEGLMEAVVLLEVATPAALQASMERCYHAAFGHSIAQEFGADWAEFFPFPQIPAMALRAPVYPSTHD